MLRRLVGHGRDHRHTAPVRRVDRELGLARVVDRAERLLDDGRARVEPEEHTGAEARRVGDEGIAHAYRDERALRAGADVADAVVGGGRVLGLTGAVAVVHRVERVVVTEEEVPSGDVVDVAVVVVVGTVRVVRVEDQVLGIGDAVAVAIRDRSEVGDGEAAVTVAVAARRGARRRHLTAVEVRPIGEIAHRTRIAPFDPGVEHRDPDVGPAARDPPCEIDGGALLPAEVVW